MSSQELKALRNARNITVREVELESQRIAEAKNDKRFYISNARLTQLENDPLSDPSVWKLFSLSAIYRVSITDLMRVYIFLVILKKKTTNQTFRPLDSWSSPIGKVKRSGKAV
ncbi:MAG TPA: hypothetical protein VE135_15945 [Pyrinomonadaceae bacterium]|nr:hypothetical protein [Pyrinomonadaceae bacterium]